MASTSRFGRLTLVTGPEGLLADRAVEQARAEALAEDPSAQVAHVEAVTLTGEALAEMTGASLFADHVVAIIRNIADLPADLADPVVALARDVPAEVALVLQHSGGNKGKGVLDKLKKTKPEIVDCPALKQYQLPDFVIGEARRQGTRIDANAARALVMAVGPNLRALASAMEQLLSDADGAVIDSDFIARYFAGRAEVTAYTITDDILAGHVNQALEKLRWALETGMSPVQFTAALAGSLRTLGKYVAVRDARMRDVEIASAIGCPPWKIKDLAHQASSWSEQRIAAGLLAVADADAQVKGASATSDFALERLVLQLSQRVDPAGRRSGGRGTGAPVRGAAATRAL